MSASRREEYIYRVAYILSSGRGKNRVDTPIVVDWLFNEFDEKFAICDLKDTLSFVASRAANEGKTFDLVDINLLGD